MHLSSVGDEISFVCCAINPAVASISETMNDVCQILLDQKSLRLTNLILLNSHADGITFTDV